MTDTTTPIQAAFEMHRQSTEHAQQLLQQSLDLQRNVAETFLRNGMAAQRSAQERIAGLAHAAANGRHDAVDPSVREDRPEFRATTDEQFEAFDEAHSRAWDQLEAELGDALEDISEQQRRLVAKSFEAFLDAHRDAERQTVDEVRQTEGDVREATESAADAPAAPDAAADAVADLQDELREAAEEVDALHHVDGAAAEGLVEGGIETLDDLASAQADVVAEAASTTEDTAEEWIDAAAEYEDVAVGALDGIGETYSDRLATAGIRTVDQLARTSAEEVADVAEVAEDRAAEWIEAAQSQA